MELRVAFFGHEFIPISTSLYCEVLNSYASHTPMVVSIRAIKTVVILSGILIFPILKSVEEEIKYPETTIIAEEMSMSSGDRIEKMEKIKAIVPEIAMESGKDKRISSSPFISL